MSLIWGNGWTLVGRATFKNSGQTPAYGLSHAGRFEIGDPESFDERLLEIPINAKGDFGAGAEIPAKNIRADLTEDQWRDIKTGKVRLYMWGRASYDDAFKKQRRFTRYRLIFDPGDEKWAPCPEGNEST